ncbi:hypothetical protein GALL_458270 [mine drainage metagenome]|uniref:Uncharacterized protein n=1 Tax=mine drainage metagenome TaxID=410659 RepID=A0A1J5PYA7_9ZZZZ
MMTTKTGKTAVKAKAKPVAAAEPQPDWAKLAVCPGVASAAAAEDFNRDMMPDLKLSDLIDEVKSSIKAVQSGDMSGMESMLVGQAQALQTVFVSLMRKAHGQEYMKNYGAFMTMALKAQAQSRATIQALAEVKYPRQVFITKQANISNGPQQVNNGTSHAAENQNEQSKLISGDTHATLDCSGTSAASGTNQELEAMGAINRPDNARG